MVVFLHSRGYLLKAEIVKLEGWCVWKISKPHPRWPVAVDLIQVNTLIETTKNS